MHSSNSNKNTHFNCAVVGEWHLAFVTAACLSSLGHRVLLVNPRVDHEWVDFPKPPVIEPGLNEMIASSLETGCLSYANGVNAEWTSDAVWLAVDTPVDERDVPDTSTLKELALQLHRFKKVLGPFIVSSQVPIGFCGGLERDLGFKVAYVPENLRLGKGIETFLGAERTVIGANSKQTLEWVQKFLAGIKTEFFTCDLPTSEMVKHATNAFLATSISFANELARLGEPLGVDNQAVAKALKLDKRIGKMAYVAPGLGFAGGTLPRDLRVLQQLGREHGIKTSLFSAVTEVNDATADAVVNSVRSYLGGLSAKRILVLGYTYKADTDTLRRSYSVAMAKEMKREGAQVFGFDPVMNLKDLSEIQGVIEHVSEWNQINASVDAIMVMTPRKEFAELRWEKFARSGHKALVLDAHQFLSADRIFEAGLAYKALWQPVRSPG